jgi:hypothetical protein
MFTVFQHFVVICAILYVDILDGMAWTSNIEGGMLYPHVISVMYYVRALRMLNKHFQLVRNS